MGTPLSVGKPLSIGSGGGNAFEFVVNYLDVLGKGWWLLWNKPNKKGATSKNPLESVSSWFQDTSSFVSESVMGGLGEMLPNLLGGLFGGGIGNKIIIIVIIIVVLIIIGLVIKAAIKSNPYVKGAGMTKQQIENFT